MSRFSYSTLIGTVGGLTLIGGLIAFSPESVAAFVNLPGLLVVLGGTLLATLVSRPLSDVYHVLRNLPGMFRSAETKIDREIEALLRVAECRRHSSLRAAEKQVEAIGNEFLRTGLQQVLDRIPRSDLLRLLQWRIAAYRAHQNSEIQIVRTMAAFAPAFGMLGTLFGLVHMLYGLDQAGIAQVGSSMGFAMITTLYGIMAANLFLKPLSIKMEQRANHRLVLLNMLMEGILMVHDSRHPTLIRENLASYLFQPSPVTAPPPVTLARAGA